MSEKLKQLRNALGDKMTELEANRIKLEKNENLTGEERKKIMAETKTMLNEIKELNEEIDLFEAMESEKRDSGEPEKEERKEVTSESPKVIATPEEKRKLSLGEYLQCVALVEAPRAANLRTQNIGGAGEARKLLTAHEARENRAATGLNEKIPSDGGFLVGTDFSSELLTKAHDAAQLASRVRKMGISSSANSIKIPGIDETSRADGSRWGGVVTYWADEAAAYTASAPKFKMIELALNKLTGLCYATDEMLQDSSVLGGVISNAFTEEFAFKIDDCIFGGDGAGKPLGIYGHSSTISVAKESGQSADTIVFANVAKMWARLWNRSRGNAVWVANQDIIPQLMQLKDSAGNAIFLPANGAAGSPLYDTLLGKPVLYIEQAKTLGDLGDLSLMDLSQYIMIDKGRMNSASSMHVRFLYDEMVYKFTYRVDGQPIWTTALTPANGSNTVSPFVMLAARA